MRNRVTTGAFALFISCFFLLNFYVWSGLRVISDSFWVGIIFWLLMGLSATSLLISVYSIQRKGITPFFKLVSHFFLILLVSELVFSSMLITFDIYRSLLGLVRFFTDGSFILIPRNPYLVSVALILFAGSVLVFLYGIFKGKYAYRVIRHDLEFDDLPAAFDGFKIVQISDTHLGSFKKEAPVRRAIKLIQEQKADLFVFTGDLVNNKAEEVEPWLDILAQIRAPYGQFSVLGNHDYGDYIKWKSIEEKQYNLQLLKAYHDRLGYRLLLDEHVIIDKEGQHLVLLGVENWGVGFGERGDLEKALRGSDTNSFKVLLSHDPSHWESKVKHHPTKIHLTLSGHTHGMQFGIEALGIKWSPVKFRYRHWAGLKEHFGRILNINRGFGFIGFSGRIGIWPEITLITLKNRSTN